MGPLVDDLRHMTAAWDDPPAGCYSGSMARLPLYPRIGAVVSYRAGSWCWHHGLRPVALCLQAWTIRSSGAEIHPAARIGAGLRHQSTPWASSSATRWWPATTWWSTRG